MGSVDLRGSYKRTFPSLHTVANNLPLGLQAIPNIWETDNICESGVSCYHLSAQAFSSLLSVSLFKEHLVLDRSSHLILVST